MKELILICPQCKHLINRLYPEICSACHYSLKDSDSIYIFSKEPNILLEGDKQYIGFDAFAEHYDATRHLIPNLADITAKQISNIVKTKNILLDIGAGTGVFSIALARYFKEIIAADISSEMLKKMIKKAKEKNIKNILATKINIYNIPIVDKSIDVVFAANILNHISKPENVIKEIQRVLKKDGLLLIIYYEMIECPQNDINEEIESIYYEELNNKNIKVITPLGWIGPKIDIEVQKYFKKKEIFRSTDLRFRLQQTPYSEYFNLKTKQYPTQMLVDQELNTEIMNKIDKIMKQKYGDSYINIDLYYTMDVCIGVYGNINA